MNDPLLGAVSCVLALACLVAGARMLVRLHAERRLASRQDKPLAGEDTALLVVAYLLNAVCAAIVVLAGAATYAALQH